MSFSREQLTYASGSLLDGFGAEKGLTRNPGESCVKFRGRIDLAAFPESVVNGGFAFGEFKQYGEIAIKAGGITVRDYFAAKAMTAMIANTSQSVLLGCDYPDNNFNYAMAAYAVADAMLAARGESK